MWNSPLRNCQAGDSRWRVPSIPEEAGCPKRHTANAGWAVSRRHFGPDPATVPGRLPSLVPPAHEGSALFRSHALSFVPDPRGHQAIYGGLNYESRGGSMELREVAPWS